MYHEYRTKYKTLYNLLFAQPSPGGRCWSRDPAGDLIIVKQPARYCFEFWAGHSTPPESIWLRCQPLNFTISRCSKSKKTFFAQLIVLTNVVWWSCCNLVPLPCRGRAVGLFVCGCAVSSFVWLCSWWLTDCFPPLPLLCSPYSIPIPPTHSSSGSSPLFRHRHHHSIQDRHQHTNYPSRQVSFSQVGLIYSHSSHIRMC